ncbi:MAG: YHYH protein [Chitinophagales bacterium]
MRKKQLVALLLTLLLIPIWADAHHTHYDHVQLRQWQANNSKPFHASFTTLKNDTAYFESEEEHVLAIRFDQLSIPDQQYIHARMQQVLHLNTPMHVHEATPAVWPLRYWMAFLVSLFAGLLFITWLSPRRYRVLSAAGSISLLLMASGFMYRSVNLTTAVSDPLSIDSSFTPFKPGVITSWDNNYFYVEDNGIPGHDTMMTGIVSWQQQVPIPQCYYKPNAWMIPLNTTVASNPIPVDSIHFTRGAIAIAANGIPIFNYHTNTGVDAFIDGQLDQWGGHSGRADDYHYHIAPMHLYRTLDQKLPVAYALDGFAVYGNVEPDGSPRTVLDANNGHFGANGVYHYHAVPTAPYMIGKMVGVVNEDSTHQIIPQARAQPVRPSLTPLTGAVITNFVPNQSTTGYTLTYQQNGQSYQVIYSWSPSGKYDFSFVSPTTTTTATYQANKTCNAPSGIITPSAKRLLVSPNPAHGHVHIRCSEFSPAAVTQLALISETGAMIQHYDGYRDEIPLTHMAAGVYFVVAQTKEGALTQKIIVQP